MLTASQKLIELLNLNKGKPSFKRTFNFKLYPFFTRNPERAKFNNGFTPILGAIARHSLNLKTEYTIDDYNIESLYENVDSVNGVDDERIIPVLDKIFGFENIKSLKHPYLLNYYPLSQSKDKRGEMDIALYINRIFDLKNNRNWHQFVGDKKTNNLAEKLILDSIEEIEEIDEKNIFKTILGDLLLEKNKDLEFLLKNKDFALKNLDKFFAFYYFQYILQTVLNNDRIRTAKEGVKLYPLYYTLESEKITSSRVTNTSGYNLIKEISKYTLVNENLIGYLNILIRELNKNESFYTFTDILNLSSEKQLELNQELQTVLNKYKNVLNKEENIKFNLEENIELLKKWLSEDITNETISRYHLSIEEIGKLMFLKNRGSLGKTLTLKKDMIILLTALIVKDEKKLVKDVFMEFEKRGVYFDRYTKEEIMNFYEKMNILDKKSDSGEVKYVKPVL
ncbi:DNA phosphorothioation-dependent restriction protein DptG [Staphylococcus capitis]|uniref:DNA phosphorothioation-dependent restriction protein DptG n=1 Tax=Staphylococcus capitis TaxID=29388 RepID=UPI0011A2200D|nr:DNA phosphorothioation-dependent restriction protein DptG [Staphylococcus capitis]MCC0829846.1 DNA phosphorothioation-dependent restriction protein DptG [Staphylococcus capitis]MCC3743621.1 DNA phosphorothioation-dependent restriction protein DptG [Staphylococcus capitis]MDS0929785.1 DNA phosphorothioation-dependent restriction protein DptG [Staphylococcus capitis]NMK81708.1 DNA phosphorothioation-dependent restriction protein DptG [Staphylococcus capitis]